MRVVYQYSLIFYSQSFERMNPEYHYFQDKICHESEGISSTNKRFYWCLEIMNSDIRRFQNKCDIVEEPNSSTKHDTKVKFFSLITRNLVF